MNSNADIYESVTLRILECLDKGVVPWRKPWGGAAPRNLSSGHVYKGINQILLSCAAFGSPYWMTFKQARALGGNVKRGERGTPIVFWKVYEKEKANGETDTRFVLRRFFVFNAEQTEGVYIPKLQEPRAIDPIEDCERIVSSFKDAPTLIHGGNRACYVPSLDQVQVPQRNAFSSAEEYYSTLFHEFIHATGAAKRLARKGVTDVKGFSSHEYSYEELIAECGSAFLCAHAGIAPKTLDNSASYIGFWSKALKNDPTWLVRAASAAAKASDFILGKQWKSEDSEDEDAAKAA
jgi:antirestriction protein ArdC